MKKSFLARVQFNEGILVGVTPIFNFLGSLFWGILSDAFNDRKNLFLIGTIIGGSAFWLYNFQFIQQNV